MRIEHVGEGMILNQDVIDDRGNLLLEKGICLTRSYISGLKRLGIYSINITDPYAETLNQEKIVNSQLRQELTQCFAELFNIKAADILNFKAPAEHLHKLNSVVGNVIDETASRLDQVVNLEVRRPSTDEAEHAVNVCLLSVITGLYLKFERNVLHNLALGALLHDLGKSLLPPEDLDMAFLHTNYGRELLLNSTLNLVIALIAAEHHEAVDGSGKPQGLSGRDIHPLSRLVAITNFFDLAMSASTQNGSARQEIIEEMMGAGNIRFDLNLLRAFLNTIAIFPVGSRVRLNNGCIAYIVSNRVHYPLRPFVRIFENFEYIDIDLVLKPSITITEFISD